MGVYNLLEIVLLHILFEHAEISRHRFEGVNLSCRAHEHAHQAGVVTSARASIDASHPWPNDCLHQRTNFGFVITHTHQDAHFPILGLKPESKSVYFGHPGKSTRQDWLGAPELRRVS